MATIDIIIVIAVIVVVIMIVFFVFFFALLFLLSVIRLYLDFAILPTASSAPRCAAGPSTRHDNWTRYPRASEHGATALSRPSLPAECRGFETRLPLHLLDPRS